MLQEGGGGIKLEKSSKRPQKWNFFEINNLKNFPPDRGGVVVVVVVLIDF